MARRLVCATPLTILAVAAALLIGLTTRGTAPTQVARPGATCAEGESVGGAGLWKATMEKGSLDEWLASGDGSLGAAGGGPFDSGSAWSAASRSEAHNGAWSVKLVLPDGRGGARLFRWRELRDHRDTVIRVWLQVPRRHRLTANPARGRFWDVFQFKSRSPSGLNDPLWFLNLASARGRLRLELVWWSRTLQGPHRHQAGFRRIRQHVADVPIGRWFLLSARLRQSKDFDGLLCVWQDGRLLFAMRSVRTSYANCAYNDWCAANEWSVNNYSDGLSPSPSVIFADDAAIARL